jgi:predicted SAM-dependent methyltransferase
MEEVKLHLGCGSKHIDGFINVDIREEVNPDLIDDIGKLESIKENSVDLIYVCHTLEHFGRHEYMTILERWFELLKEGGIIRISVPDFGKVVEYYNETGDVTKLIGLLYGGQTYAENYHYITWDFQSLKNDLVKVGFKAVLKYDWRDTEHSELDDFSQSYLPHMDKDNGKLMSLNVEAVK